jgi:tRNA A37 methylthiotransferase MiaB
MIIQTTIASYDVNLRCVQNYSTDKASISCYSPNKRTELLIIFQSESEEVGTARIDELPSGNVRIVVYFPMSMFGSIHHVLQTEKPIQLYANNSNNYTQVNFGTGTEPVGEEEGS